MKIKHYSDADMRKLRAFATKHGTNYTPSQLATLEQTLMLKKPSILLRNRISQLTSEAKRMNRGLSPYKGKPVYNRIPATELPELTHQMITIPKKGALPKVEVPTIDLRKPKVVTSSPKVVESKQELRQLVFDIKDMIIDTKTNKITILF